LPGESADAVQEQIRRLIKGEAQKISGIGFAVARIMDAVPLKHKAGRKEIAGAQKNSAIPLTGETIPCVGADLFSDDEAHSQQIQLGGKLSLRLDQK
tara:strand:+ start:230 stop:520 length:291 start_codon:yes stop_codon:yes gene_type:complete